MENQNNSLSRKPGVCEKIWKNPYFRYFLFGVFLCLFPLLSSLGVLPTSFITLMGSVVIYSVVGIGLNVHNTTFPKAISDIATSLFMETGEKFSKSRLSAEILNSLEEHLGRIQDKSFIDDYRRRSNIIGKRIEITHNDEVTQAECIGIDEICRLLVRYDNGEEKALMSGTIRVVK